LKGLECPQYMGFFDFRSDECHLTFARHMPSVTGKTERAGANASPS
jgi:hypothetical protein